MKQKSRAPSKLKSRAPAFCSLALALPLAAGPFLSGCDSMQSNRKTKEGQALIPQKQGPAEDTSAQVLSAIKSNSPMDEKFAAVKQFVDTYSGGEHEHWAAAKLSKWAESEFGSDFTMGPKGLESDKNRMNLGYSLAYGLSLFGRPGLGESIKLVARMDNGRKDNEFKPKERFSLSLFVAMNTVGYLKDSGKLSGKDKEAAVKYITTFLTKNYVSFDTKMALATLAKEIDPGSIKKLARNAMIDPTTREALFKMEANSLKGRLKGATQ
jgi:hypothetical protein